ncbi:MAG: hypothetical protein CMD06_03665, partial [Flavobacteriales bacterium]|nr:hypothetical protein [Flavobacteriales bacterium]
MTQTNPATPVKLMNYRYATATFLIGYGNSGVGTGLTQPFNNMIATNYRMLMVDSVAFWNAFPNGNPTSAQILSASNSSILDYVDYTVLGVPELSVVTNQTIDNLCNGDCDAAEQITILGGTPPYQILMDGQLSTLGLNSLDTTYINLCEGTYSLTVSDINGCSMSPSSPTSFSIAAPPPLSPNGSISSNYNGQDISCAGASDGIIVGAVAGGTPPYQYSIDGGANWSGSAVFSNLSAGTYTITYQDANLCETTESFTLNDPPLLSGAITINQQVSCNAACDGEIEFIVNNVNTGTPGYSFSIDNGSTFQNSPVFSNVCGDQNHTIIVQDANGCQATANIFIGQPTAISFSATSSSFNGFGVSCNGANDGEIIIFSPSGGVPNYDYSIDGGATFSNSMIYSNLGAGSYLVTVRDNNGCIKDTLITLNEPGPFTVSSSVTNPISCPGLCDGGITALQSNGVSPITYNLTTFPSQTFNVWSGLCGDITYGSYTLDATDANGCFATTTVTLIEPLPFTYTVDSIQETCNSSNGQASINVAQGGTAPYAYLWDDPFPQQITATATGLTTGTYTVVVTDANGCNFTEDIFVGEADIELSFDSVPPCNGGNDGSATVIPDGIPPYVITWETGETTTTINNLSPGFYTVTVTDNTGCIATDSVEVPASAVVDVVLDVQNSNLVVPCFGDPSSGVSVIATGGTGPNTYLYYIPNVFPTPQASSTFSGLYAGTYQIYAVDANGCFDSVEVTITQPTELIYTVSSTDVSCNGGSDGTAFIDTIYGGNPSYVYLWSNGQTTNTISSLFAGSYTVTVTDANGCSSIPSTATVIVDEPDALQSNINVLNNSNCAGSQALATGEMEVSVTGGTTGYNYSWSTGSTNPNIGFLLPGTYTVTITDANNCSITDSAEILPGENPTLDVTIENVTCFGDNDGMIYTSAIGGTPTYSFSADGGITFVPSGTPFGPTGGASYFITVVDALGCTDSDSIFVFEPDLLTITSFSNQSISCYDSLDGEISVIHSGGTAPYTYLWDNGQTTNPAVDLGPGNYNVTVTDTNGCTTSLSTTLIQPDSLEIISIISGDVSCYGGSDGSMQVSLSGGTPNYNYNWSNGATTSIVSNVSSGTYSVTVFDQNGCTNTANIDVVQPADITVNYVRDSVSCLGGSNGSAIALVSGGVPGYTYLWENGNTSNTIINLSPGYYNLTIIDSNACTKQDSVEILGPTTSIAIDSMIVHPITCHDANNGSITILATGGQQPYTYSNTNGFNSQSTISFINLSPDTYIVYVEDAKGCWDRDTVVITNPDSLYIDSTIHTNVKCNGYQDAEILAINAFGGIPPYEYAVNGGTHYTNMAYFNGYGPGTYTVEVFDANNCAAQDLIIIEEPDEINLSITTSLWNSYEVRCNGDSSGYADLVISGGQAPYLKVVLDSQLDTVLTTYNNNITGLYADTYTFHVWDNNGCPKEEVIIYNEPTPIVHNFIANHITCDGWSNGSLVDSVYGGVGNASTYQYAWNTGDSTYIITSIPVGTYVMTIVDENNCISIDSFEINDNNILQANLDISTTNNVSCYNYCDATIGVLASGGAPNINSFGNPVYSYSWNDTLLQSTATAIGLCVDNNTDSSTYMCVVSDGQGCSDTLEYIVTQPDSLNVIAEIVSDVLCFGDNNGKLTASISPAGGTAPFTYLWNNETNFDSNPANNNLYSGSYVVVAKDVNGCMDTT